MSQDRRATSNPFDSQDFRKEFEETLTTKLDTSTEPILDLLRKHDSRIAALETKAIAIEGRRNRQTGFMSALALAWSAILIWLDHAFFRKPV